MLLPRGLCLAREPRKAVWKEAIDDRVVRVAVLVQVGVDGQRARGVYAHARPTASLPVTYRFCRPPLSCSWPRVEAVH
jgi:hypothetical protein